jgi:hypothetical protein
VTTEIVYAAAFTVGVAATIAAYAAASAGRLPQRAAVALGAVLGSAAISGWAAFAFDLEPGTAVAAGGLSACALAQVGAVRLHDAVARQQRVDAELRRAELHLHQVVEREVQVRAEELERTLLRARAESISLLVEEERRFAEQRRSELAAGEQNANEELARALAAVRQRVDQRLSSWTSDLDRVQQSLGARIKELQQRQEQLLHAAEGRLADDTRLLEQTVDEQRASIVRQREELERAAHEVIGSAAADLETHAAERRRALHEVADRLRRRERELRDRIDREETEAAQRIQTRFEDVERRQVEGLQRLVERAAARYAEAGERQFDEAIKHAREEAAKRLARELDRGVASFARQAEAVLGEKLSQVADVGAQRIEQRIDQRVEALDRQSEELVGAVARRTSEVEVELRRRLEAIAADVEAERTLLEARLQELQHRLDQALAHSNR